MKNHKVKCSNFEIANDKPFTLIAGPCQLENEEHALKISTELKKIKECIRTIDTRWFWQKRNRGKNFCH